MNILNPKTITLNYFKVVEKCVKIFSIDIGKLQRNVGDLKEVVDTMLIDENRDDLDEAPEFKQEAMNMMIIDIKKMIKDIELSHFRKKQNTCICPYLQNSLHQQ
jgi:hypothetical protein